MSTTTFRVCWRDANASGGIQGIVEVSKLDLSVRTPAAAASRPRVRELMDAIDEKLGCEGGKGTRWVQSLSLYGLRLEEHRRLGSLIPALSATRPALVAITHRRKSAPSTTIRVHVKSITTGNVFTLDCYRSDSIHSIVQRLCDDDGLRGMTDFYLRDSHRTRVSSWGTLADEKIEDGTTLMLCPVLRGGGGPMPPKRPFADIADDTKLLVENFDNRAPRWRVCHRGLNIEARCMNSQCEASGHVVICRQQYAIFNLITDLRVLCPMCSSNATPVTCGFYRCVWKFEGLRARDQCLVSSPWRIAHGEHYHRFDADEEHGSIEWESLLISVKSTRAASAARLTKPSAAETTKLTTCAICWFRLGSTTRELVIMESCGHCFHRVCVQEWRPSGSSQHALEGNAVQGCPICSTGKL